MIRLSRPYFDHEEREAVERVLASGMLVQGEEVRCFEQELLGYLRQRFPSAPLEHTQAIAVSNGTAALELALTAMQIGVGDEVLVPALTWPSPGNAVLLRGAVPVLVDVDSRTFNFDPVAAAAVRTKKTKALIAIDQFGVPADFPAIQAKFAGLSMLEDAACAIGSALHNVPCGLHGELGTLSFHPRKVLTTGEGGMVLTNDPRLATRIRTLRNHGQEAPTQFAEAGPNERLSELHAAIGRAQTRKLAQMLNTRIALAEELRAALPLWWQQAPDGAVVNHQTLGFVLPKPSSGTRLEARIALCTALRSAGVEAGMLSYALPSLPQFSQHAVNAGRRFPIAETIAAGGVALPLHASMTSADVGLLVDALRSRISWAFDRNPFVDVE